jgi:hypothetical protein
VGRAASISEEMRSARAACDSMSYVGRVSDGAKALQQRLRLANPRSGRALHRMNTCHIQTARPLSFKAIRAATLAVLKMVKLRLSCHQVPICLAGFFAYHFVEVLIKSLPKPARKSLAQTRSGRRGRTGIRVAGRDTKSRPNECLGDSAVNVRRGGHVRPTDESPKGVLHEKERRHSSGSGGG